MITTELNIGQVVRQTLKESDETNLNTLVDLVVSKLDPRDYETYLRQLLREKVTTEMGTNRNVAITRVKNDSGVDKYSTREPEPQTFIGVDDPAPKLVVNNWRRDAIRDAFFNQLIPVENGVKRLSELTVDDIRYVARVRYAQADAVRNAAQAYDRLADEMVEKRVDRLGELDYTYVKDALKGA